MDVHSVTMDAEAAAKAFREYRAAFMAERNRVDGELMRGYKALAEGKTLVSLREAIQRGGVDELGRPKLAIARADESQVAMEIRRNGSVIYRPTFRTQADDRRFDFAAGTLPEPPITSSADAWQQPWANNWWARLPFIPPLYRPPLALPNYHLLWEAEWRRGTGPQRRDPMLLRRIGGDLFAVVAAWDLTEVEKLVLAR
jgi:hypothetical protein